MKIIDTNPKMIDSTCIFLLQSEQISTDGSRTRQVQSRNTTHAPFWGQQTAEKPERFAYQLLSKEQCQERSHKRDHDKGAASSREGNRLVYP